MNTNARAIEANNVKDHLALTWDQYAQECRDILENGDAEWCNLVIMILNASTAATLGDRCEARNQLMAAATHIVHIAYGLGQREAQSPPTP